jgi:predicted RNA-binding Zn-ribbon protein involved in translation (DUF1610 family)
MSEDPEFEAKFRYCIYCGVDCYPDGEVDVWATHEVEHADDCPSTTGVFPVREEDAGPPCPHCGERIDGEMLCSDCDQPLRVGDHYTHRALGDNGGLVICLGCSARDELLAPG